MKNRFVVVLLGVAVFSAAAWSQDAATDIGGFDF